MAIQSLANCIDFLSEKTCLMYLGDLTNQLNVTLSLQGKELNIPGVRQEGSIGKQGCLIERGRRTSDH
jgi:hypothetical protein